MTKEQIEVYANEHKDVDESEEYLSRYCEECPLNEL